jgi:hypothetical protein
MERKECLVVENTTMTTTNSKKTRQFYLSLDVDLTKIETKSHF